MRARTVASTVAPRVVSSTVRVVALRTIMPRLRQPANPLLALVLVLVLLLLLLLLLLLRTGCRGSAVRSELLSASWQAAARTAAGFPNWPC